MKKIVYIGNKLSKKGKTQTSIETLSRHLILEDFEVVTASEKSNKVLRLLDMAFTVLKNTRPANYVLIDTYSTSNFYYAYIVSMICKFFSIKYIPILRGGNLPSRLKTNTKMSQAIFAKAYKNVAPSRYLQSVFNNHGYTNTICIPNSIEIVNYTYHEKSFDTLRLLWVRSFSKIYNPQMALYVLKKLNENNIKAKLCMVGPEVDGSMIATKNLAKALEVEVEFTGKLRKEEWIALSKGYNVFINTTDFDNTPVSVIEAMALGLPVVSTNVGGIPYLIDDSTDGYLVKPNDVDAMVEKILYVFNHQEEAINSTRAARRKVEEFDWEIIKHHWLGLLK